MQEKDHIAELFKDTFNNYEAPVRPELWQQVASKIQTPVTPSVPDGSSVTQVAAVTSKISGGIIAWVGAAAIVVSIATGYYIINRNQVSTADTTDQEQAPSVATITAPETQGISDATETNSEVESASNDSKSNLSGIDNSGQKEISDPNQLTEAAIPSTSSSATNNKIINVESTETTADINSQAAAKDNGTKNHNTLNNSNSTTSETQVIRNKVKATPVKGYAPLQVEFTASHSGDGNEWSFGDGSETVKGFQQSHTYNKPGTYLVTLKNTDETGKIFTELVTIEVLSDLTITNIPNIFTPNGDGSNDLFQINAGQDIDIDVSIFDKTGKFIYKFQGAENSWNGKTSNLQEAEEGTYFYVIFATGKNGDKNTQKGTITLKR